MASLVRLAALLAFVGVAAGAFGAHGLRGTIPDRLLEAYQTGVFYHLVHSLALLAMAALTGAVAVPFLRLASIFMVAGILLFSGSLYAMALTGITALGIVTPFGGVAFLGGWLILAGGASRNPAS
jgi:uncharacterized membrane protein YgdD (TMEM256/DUF423 family)